MGNINPGITVDQNGVGAMRAGIHRNSYDSRGNGVFIDDESRRRLAAQDLRSCTVEVPLSATSFWRKSFHSIRWTQLALWNPGPTRAHMSGFWEPGFPKLARVTVI